MNILGIDIGLATNAVSVLNEKGQIIYTEFTPTNSKDSLPCRYQYLFDKFKYLLQTFSIEVISYEHPVMHTKQGHQLSGVVAILLLASNNCDRDITIQHYAPTQLKLVVTGSGKASKADMEYHIKNKLTLPNKPLNNHCIDAIAAAYTFLVKHNYIENT